ncbi:MAG: SMC family ATPase [Candidatus Aenigmatarchaeota archaeon]
MITKVVLKNWRSHLNTILDFSSGTNALVGIMGSGKTSVLDAICFALFGTFPTLQSRKVKLDDIIMKKPVMQDKAEVELFFSLNNSNYVVKRVVERGKGTIHAEIAQDGKIIESDSSIRVTEVIEKILKTNYDLFSKAIYSEQNALDYFLTIAKGQRMKKIDELLMLDKFDKVRTNLVSLINKLSEKRKVKMELISKIDIETLKINIEKLKNEIEKLKIEKEELQKNLVQIISEREKLEKEIEEIKNVRESLESLNREERALELSIQELQKNLASLEIKEKKIDKKSLQEDFEKIIKKLKELEEVLTERKKSYLKIQEELVNSKVEIEMMKSEKIKKLEEEFEEKSRIKLELEKYTEIIGKGINKSLEEKKQLLEKINEEFHQIKAKILTEQDSLIKIDKASGKCPICESKLTEKKKISLIKQKKDRIEILTKELKELEKVKMLNEEEVQKLEEDALRLNKMLEEVEDYNQIKEELEEARKILMVKTEIASKLEKEFNKLEKELEDLQKEYKEYTEEKIKIEKDLSKINLYEDSVKRIQELSNLRDEISKHVSELEKTIKEKQLDEKENWLRNLVGKEKSIETKILALDQIINEKKLRLNEFEVEFDKILKEKIDITKLENLERNLKIFQFALEKTQDTLRREFVISVNFYMNKLWSELYPYQDYVGIRLAVEEGDYVLQLQERAAHWVNVDGIASGGERSIAALTLRIAFALVLAPHLRWLVLDEPTHNLDAQAVSVLATTLRDRIGEYIDQVFLITHDERLEEAVTGNLYIFKREKEKDGFTQVIKIS